MDADARFMRLEVVRTDEAHVVRRDDRHAARACKLERALEIRFFARPPGALQFEIITIAEQLEPKVERGIGFVVAPVEKRSTDIALLRARQGDDASERLLVEPSSIDHCASLRLPLEIGAAHEARQIQVAARALTQEHEARWLDALARFAHEQIDPDDRLDPRRLRSLVELHHGEEVALVRQSHRGHSGGRRRFHEPRNPFHLASNTHDAVDQRVLGVQVKVNKHFG